MLQKRKEIPVLKCDLLNARSVQQVDGGSIAARRKRPIERCEHLTHSSNKRSDGETMRVQ